MMLSYAHCGLGSPQGAYGMTPASSESRSHAKWDGTYHGVFSPQGRKKALYGKMRTFGGPGVRALAGPRGSPSVEGHMVQDHGQRLLRMPPQSAVAAVLGYSKGQSASAVARQFGGRPRHLQGERCWA